MTLLGTICVRPALTDATNSLPALVAKCSKISRLRSMPAWVSQNDNREVNTEGFD